MCLHTVCCHKRQGARNRVREKSDIIKVRYHELDYNTAWNPTYSWDLD